MVSVLDAGRSFMRVAALISVIGAAACGSGEKSKPQVAQTGTASAPAGAATAAPNTGAPFAPVVASSELVVGPSRFALGIIDQATRQPVPDARVHFRFFTLQGDQGTLRFEADPTFIAPARDAGVAGVTQHIHLDGTMHPHANVEADVGVYVASVQFDQAGRWGVETTFRTKDGREGKINSAFEVLAQPVSPAIGATAPRTKNLTARDVRELSQISSAIDPTPALYQTTVADAISAGRPALVAFVTPGYCATQFCGPTYELVKKINAEYGDRAAVIHIEVWKDPVQKVPFEALAEWNLKTEPYIFIVDRAGTVAAKFEGPVGLAELQQAMAKVTS
jgi:hypothetical protein